MKMNFIKIFWLLFYILIFFLLLHNSFSYLDPDLGWHLQAGKEIVNIGSVPYENTYHYTLEGQKWIDHEWLLDAFSFWVYSNWGYIVLSIIFALLVVLTLALWHNFIHKNYVKNSRSLFFVVLFFLWGVIAISPHIGVRMQEITLLNLALLLIIIFYYNKNKDYRILLFLPFLFYFWACVHAGFLIGLFLAVLFPVVKIGERFLAKFTAWDFIDYGKILSGKKIFSFFVFVVISFIATLLTPYGGELYSFLGGYANTFYMTHIQEWLGQYYLPLNYWQLVYLSTGAAILVLWIAQSFHKGGKFKIDLWQLCLFLLFLFLAFKSRRHFPLFFLVSLPIIIYFSVNFFSIKEKSLNFKGRWLDFLIKAFLIMCFISSILLIVININFVNNPFQNYCKSYPCEAVDFLKNNSQYRNYKIFNNYGWGGYLSWRYPQKKLFIDGRLPQHEFAGHTILEEYFEFFEEEKIEKKLQEYNIEMILMEAENKKNPLKLDWFERYFLMARREEPQPKDNHLLNFLKESPKWKIIHKNDMSLIFVKRK